MKSFSWRRWLKSLFSSRTETPLPVPPFSWGRWLKSLVAPRQGTYRTVRYLPRLEELESRVTPTTYTWSGAAGTGLWSTPGNWQGNAAPSVFSAATDTYVFGSAAAVGNRITSDNIPNLNPLAIQISAAGYTLGGPDGLTLGNKSTGGGTLTVSALGETISASMTLTLGGAASSSATQDTFIVNTASSLTIAGHLIGGSKTNLIYNTSTGGSSGTLVLSADNSGGVNPSNGLQGPITVNSGTLSITNANALGDGVGSISAAGVATGNVVTVSGATSSATLQVDNSAGTMTNATPIKQGLLINGSGGTNQGALYYTNVDTSTHLATNNNATWGGQIVMNGNTTFGATSFFGNSANGQGQGTFTIAGVISDTGSGFGVTKEGTGEIIFSAANTYRATTTINNGILDVQNQWGLGHAPIGNSPSNADNSTKTETIVNSIFTETGTLELDGTPPGSFSTGITLSNQLLVLNAPGAGFPANLGPDLSPLDNISGNNTWAGNIVLNSNNPKVGVFGAANVPETSNPSLTIGGLNGITNTPESIIQGTIGATGTITTTSGKNVSPITITTPSTAGLINGETVTISNVNGNTAANGSFTIANLTATTFQLVGTTGNGAFTASPNATWVAGATGNGVPITITVASVAGLAVGETVHIDNMTGNTAADGAAWQITAVNTAASTFTINQVGNGAYTGGGLYRVGPLSGTSTLTKVGNGLLVLTTDNTYTGATTVSAGVLEVESSGALGLGASGTTVSAGATLELADDFRVQHNLTPTNQLEVLNDLTLNGTGWSTAVGGPTLGALYSHDGINTWTGKIHLGAGPVGIGVDPPSTETGSPYTSDITSTGTVLDDSLTITAGGLNGVTNGLTKLGTGQLILPTANPFTADTTITAGTVTIENSNSLGNFGNISLGNQPTTTVDAGASLQLLPLSADPTDEVQTLTFNNVTGGSFGINFNGGSTFVQGIQYNANPAVLANNIQTAINGIAGFGATGTITGAADLVAGVGPIVISTPSTAGLQNGDTVTITGVNGNTAADGTFTIAGLVANTSFELLNLNGTNTVSSAAFMPSPNATWSSGVTVTPGSSSNVFTITFNGAKLSNTYFVPVAAAGNLTGVSPSITTNVITAGSAGDMTLVNQFVLSGNGVTLPGYPLLSQEGALMNLAGSNTLINTVTLNGQVGIGVEQIYNTNPASVNYSATGNVASQLTLAGPQANGAAVGGINKLGSQRLIIQGPGTYTGPVDVQQGVILDQNDTGLGLGGAATSITTVEAGAALELASTTTTETGGLQRGINVQGEALVLNGTGNPTFGDSAPLNVLGATINPIPTSNVFNLTAGPFNDPTIVTDDTWGGNVTLNTALTLTFTSNQQLVSVPSGGTFSLNYNGQPTATLGATGTVATTSGTGTAPITITTPSTTGLTNGATVTIRGVNGNTAANGIFTIANLTATTFQLVGSTGNGNFTASPNATWTYDVPASGGVGATASVQNALAALPNVGAGNVLVTGNPGGPYTVTFTGTLAGQVAQSLTGTASAGLVVVSGGAGGMIQPTLTASTLSANIVTTVAGVSTTSGFAAQNALQAITFNGVPAGGAFTLTYVNPATNLLVTTGAINFSSNPSVLAANIQAALLAPNLGASGTVTATTGTAGSPITLTTSTTTGLANGATVVVSGVTGDPNANGVWTIANVTATTFQLVGSSSNGVNLSGGSWTYNPITSAANLVVTPVASGSISLPAQGGSGTITNTSGIGSSPITITTDNTDGLSNGDIVTVSGVLGDTAADGDWIVTGLTPTSFQLAGSTANANYTGGGIWAYDPGTTRLTLSGTVSDTGTVEYPGGLDLTTIGGGELTLSGSNTYLGTTVLSSGVITVANDQALGNIGNSGEQTLALFNPVAGTTTFTLSSNVQQTVAIPVTSTFTLSYDGQSTPAAGQPGALMAGASALTVQNALQALSTIGAGNVTVASLSPSTYLVTFTGTLASSNVMALSGTASSGGTVTVTPASTGSLLYTGRATDAAALQNALNSSSVFGASGAVSSTSATGSPLVISTANTAGLANGDTVTISGVLGDSNANGTFKISNLTATSFQLVGVLSNGTGSGGTWTYAPITVVQDGSGVFDLYFGGSLTGTTPVLLPTVTSADGASAVVGPGGGTIVANGASLELQGNITVSGETLVAQGSGSPVTPTVPQQWVAVGPAPIQDGQTAIPSPTAGRINSVAIDPSDPNTIYIATAGAGAWRTTNGGQTWQQIFGAIPNVWQITVNQTSGSYTLTFQGQTTIPIAWNATAATVQADLDALSTIGGVGAFVTVTQSSNAYTVTFGGSLTSLYVAPTDLTSSTANVIAAQVETGWVTVDTVQTLTLKGFGGFGPPQTFTLSFGGQTTGNLANNVPANGGVGATASVQNALEALSSIGAGNVSVSGNPGGPYTVTFIGALANTPEPQLTWANTTTPAPMNPGTISVNTAQSGGIFQTALFTGAIAVDPLNWATIYLGTGDTSNSSDSYYGTGIYVSHNQGTTWQVLTDNVTSPGNPINPFYGKGISQILPEAGPGGTVLFIADGDGGSGKNEEQTFNTNGFNQDTTPSGLSYNPNPGGGYPNENPTTYEFSFTLNGVTGTTPVLDWQGAATGNISSVSGPGVSPIVITTNSTAGLVTGDTVSVAGVTAPFGQTNNANGTFTITVIDGTHFSLNGTSGNFAETNSGQWAVADDADALQIQNAINNLLALTFATGSVTVTPAPPSAGGFGHHHGFGGFNNNYSFLVEFNGALAQTNLQGDLQLVIPPSPVNPFPFMPPQPTQTLRETVQGGPLTVVNGAQGDPGVWRYMGGVYTDITDVVSNNRGSVVSGNANDLIYDPAAPGMPSFPNTPGPDDNYQLSFPQTNATWTSLAMLGGNLFAALGTGTGSPNNAVYWTPNPFGTLGGGGGNQGWYVGDPIDGVTFMNTPDEESAAEFPNGVSVPGQDNGNIKLTTGNGGTLFASTANGFGDLNGIYQVSINGPTGSYADWAAIPSPPFTNGEEYLQGSGNGQKGGLYDNAIYYNPPFGLYVAGEVAYNSIFNYSPIAGEVWNYKGGVWTDITVDANGNSPGPDIHAIAQGPGPNDYVYFVGDGGIWALNELTNDWTDVNGNLAITQINSVAINPNNPNVILAGTQMNGIIETTGNGTWSNVTNQTSITTGTSAGALEGGAVAFDPQNGNIAYAVGYTAPSFFGDATLYKSTQGGAAGTWTAILTQATDATLADQSPIDESIFPFAIDSVNPNRLVVGGEFSILSPQPSVLLQSLNGGASWTDIGTNLNSITFPGGIKLSNEQTTAIALATYQGTFENDPADGSVADMGANAYDPNTIYVTDGTNIAVTQDGGTTWSDISTNTGLNQLGSINQLVVDPRNSYTVYAIRAAFGGGQVWESTNAGQTWTDISNNLPNTPAWSLQLDPRTGNTYVGTDEGVYSSTNGGASWSQFGAGMPTVQVKALALNLNTNTLVAGAYGGGVYQLTLDSTPGTQQSLTFNNPTAGSTTFTVSLTINGTTYKTSSISYVGPSIDGTVNEAPGSNDAYDIQSAINTLLTTNNIPGSVSVSTTNQLTDTSFSISYFGSLAGTTPVTAVSSNDGSLERPQTVPSGGLIATSGQSTWAGPIELAGPTTISTLGVQSIHNGVFTTQFTISGTISDLPGTGAGNSNTLTKFGKGNLELDAVNTYAGLTDVQQGVLIVNNPLALSGLSTTVESGAVLELQSNLFNEPITLFGDGIAINGHNVGALFSVLSSATYTGTITLGSNATIGVQAGSTLAIDNGGSITDDGNGYDLVLEQGGTLVLGDANSYGGKSTFTIPVDTTTPNTFAGGTVVSQGVLIVQNGNALNSFNPATTPTTTTVLDGGQLLLENVNNTQQLLTLAGALGGTTQLNLGFNGVQDANPITYTGTGATDANSIQSFLDSLNIQVLSLTAAIAGSTAFNLTFNGSTTTTPIVYTGVMATDATNIQNALDSLPSISSVPGASVKVTANSTDTGFLISLEGPLATTVLPITAAVTSSDGARANVSAPNNTLAPNPITVTANASDTVFTINFGGILAQLPLPFMTASVPATQPGTVTVTGAIIVPQTESLRISGAGNGNTGVLDSFTGTNTWNGSVTLAQDTQFPLTATTPTPASNVVVGVFATNPTDSLTINGVISQAAGTTLGLSFNPLQQSNPGELILNPTGGKNTFSGSTLVYAGDLRIQQSGALGNPAGNQGTVVQSGATLQLDGSNSPLNVTNEALTLNGAGFNGSGALENVVDNGATANVWGSSITLASNSVIGVDGSSDLNVNGQVQDPNPVLVPIASSLSKVGPGTLAFTSANSYLGGTYVNQGILSVQNASGLGGVANEMQAITVNGSATGQFQLFFEGASTPAPGTAGALTVGDPNLALDMQKALNALSTIGLSGFVASTAGAVQITAQGILVTTTAPTGLTTGETVTFNGVTGTLVTNGELVNGTTYTVTVQSPTSFYLNGTVTTGTDTGSGGTWNSGVTVSQSSNLFTITFGGGLVANSTQPLITGLSGSVQSLSAAGGVITVTTASPTGLSTGSVVTLLGVTGALGGLVNNNTYTITVLSPTSFFLNGTSAFGGGSGGSWSTSNTQVIQDGAHGTVVNPTTVQTVTVTGTTGTVNLQFNGVGAGFATSVTLGGTVSQANGNGTGPIVITTPSTGTLSTGDVVTISGETAFPAANGTYAVTVIDGTHFSLNGTSSSGNGATAGATWTITNVAQDMQTALGALPAITLNGSITQAVANNGPVTITTSGPTGLVNGATVTISGTGFADGTYTITVVSPTSFTLNNTNTTGAFTANPPFVPDGTWTGTSGSVQVSQGTGSNSNVYTIDFGGGFGQSSTILALLSATGANGATATTAYATSALQVAGGVNVATEPLTLIGTGVNLNGALENVSGTNTWAQPITLVSSAALGNAGTIGADAGSTLTIAAPVGDNGAGIGLTKLGSGTVTESGTYSNTYGGLTSVNGGTLQLGVTGTAIPGNLTIGTNTGALGSDVVKDLASNQVPSPTATVTINGDGVFNLNGKSETVQALTMGGGQVNDPAGSTLTVTGSLTGAASPVVNLTGTIASAVGSGTTPVVVTATGNVGLTTGDNVKLTNVTGFAAISGFTFTITMLSPTSFALNGTASAGYVGSATTGTWTDVPLITAGSPSQVLGSGTLTLGTATSGTPTITVNGPGALAPAPDMTIAALIVPATAGAGLTKAGGGTLQITNNETYTGTTTITGGTLQVDGLLLGGTGTVTLAGGTLSGQGSVGLITPTPNGTVSPGESSPTTDILTNNVGATMETWSNTTAFNVTGNFPSVGPFSLLVVNGTAAGSGLNLGAGTNGTKLTGSNLYVPLTTKPITIIQTTGSATIQGNFTDTAGKQVTNGQTLLVGGQSFQVNYNPAGPIGLVQASLGKDIIVNSNTADLVTGDTVAIIGNSLIPNGNYVITVQSSGAFTLNGTSSLGLNTSDSSGTGSWTASSVVLTPELDTTTINLTSSTNGTSVFGQDVQFMANLTPEAGTTIPPTDTVTYTLTMSGSATALGTAAGIVITTSSTAGMTNGDSVELTGMTGALASVLNNTAPPFTITLVNGSTTQFLLNGTTGHTGQTASGGTWTDTSFPPITATLHAGTAFDPQAPVGTDAHGHVYGNLTLVPGSYSVAATYNADFGSFAPVTATPVSQQISVNPTSLSVPNIITAVYGQPIVVAPITVAPQTAVTTPPPNAITGNVVFTLNTTPATVDTLSVTAANTAGATFNTVLAVGSVYTVTVAYQGDGNYGATPSPLGVQVSITQATPVVTVSSPVSSASFGQQVTFTATVAPPANSLPGITTPMGSVSFYVGAVQPSDLLGTVLYNSSTPGSYSLNTSSLPLGTNQTITAVYNPTANDNYTTASSTLPGGFTVNTYSTSVMLGSSLPNPNPVGQDPLFPILGQSVTFTATVSPVPSGGTNQVEFFDGTNPLGSGNVNSSGVATYTTTFNTPGVHNITAIYEGNGSTYQASPPSNTVVETLSSATSTSLTASPAGSTIFGTAVTLTATVSAPGTVPPTTGNVTFYLGPISAGNPIAGTVTNPSPGVYQLTTSSLPVGANQQLNAAYSGSTDGTYAPSSTTSALPYTVQAVSTTTSLVLTPSTPNSFVAGQAVTFTATVTSTTSTLSPTTGTVQLYLNGVAFTGAVTPGTWTPTTPGVATVTLTTSALPISTSETITAKYLGSTDTDFAASLAASGGVAVIITKASLSGTLSPASGSSIYGQAITFTDTLTSSTIPAAQVSGTVNFYVNGSTTAAASVMLSGNNVATFTTSTLPAGTTAASVVAKFTPSTGLASLLATGSGIIISNTASQLVGKAAAAITSVNSGTSTNPTAYVGVSAPVSTAVTFTVNVANTSFPGGMPDSPTIITWSTGSGASVLSGSATVHLGVATFTDTFTTGGSHVFTINYGGTSNVNFNAASTQTYTQNVALATTNTLTFTAATQSFTATISPSGAATGSPIVTFLIDSQSLASAQAIPAQNFALSGPTVTFTPSGLMGSHKVQAFYSGNATYAATYSSVLTESFYGTPNAIKTTSGATSLTATAGTAFALPLEVVDSGNNKVGNYSSPVSVTLLSSTGGSEPSGILTGTLTRTFSGGLVTFSLNFSATAVTKTTAFELEIQSGILPPLILTITVSPHGAINIG